MINIAFSHERVIFNHILQAASLQSRRVRKGLFLQNSLNQNYHLNTEKYLSRSSTTGPKILFDKTKIKNIPIYPNYLQSVKHL